MNTHARSSGVPKRFIGIFFLSNITNALATSDKNNNFNGVSHYVFLN